MFMPKQIRYAHTDKVIPHSLECRSQVQNVQGPGAGERAAGKNSGKGTPKLSPSTGRWGLLLEGQRAGSTEQHYEPGSEGPLEGARVSTSTLIIREQLKPLFRHLESSALSSLTIL